MPAVYRCRVIVSSSISSGGTPSATISRTALDYLGPATIVECHVHLQAVIVAGQLNGSFDRPCLGQWHVFEAPDVTYTDSIPMQASGLTLASVGEYLHEALDFLDWAAPVFGGERVQGEHRDIHIDTCPDDAVHVSHAGPVSGQSREAPVLGPSSVAIHDDGYVLGEVGRLRSSLRVTPQT